MNLNDDETYELDMYSLLNKCISIKVQGSKIKAHMVTMSATEKQHGTEVMRKIEKEVIKTIKKLDVDLCVSLVEQDDENAKRVYAEFGDDCVIAQILRLIIRGIPLEFRTSN